MSGDSLLTAFHDSCAASPMGILARAALTLGHPHAPQGSINFSDPGASATLQGLVVLKNGAVIEHAVTGVVLGECDGCSSKSGGIIRAENAPRPAKCSANLARASLPEDDLCGT
jgi:hypothetical protein